MNHPHMHPVTLGFSDAATEQAYHDYDFQRTQVQGRFAILCALSTYFVLGLLFDRKLFPPEALSDIWQIRIAALLFSSAVLLLTFHASFRRMNYLVLSLVGLSGGLGVVFMSRHMAPEMVNFYYPVLIVVAFFTYNFVGTRFIYALGVDLCLLLAYNLGLATRGDIPMLTLAMHDYLIFVANLMGGGAGYITELQRRRLFLGELQLREKATEAERANQAKSRFLAAVSHDLRQPIHAQGLFLNVLSETKLSSRQQDIVASIHSASVGLGDMLHTLMDFSRIEAGAVHPDIQTFRLQPLFNKIENEFLPQAEAKQLAYRSRETTLSVRSDPALLGIILRNLVSNAIRYTEHGGIMLLCRKRGDHAIIEVRDSGIGIEPAQQREIFREFHQLGNPERDRRKGMGLGLAIVEGLAKALVHTVTLHSTPGQGSVFRITMPLAATAASLEERALPPATPRKSGIRILLIEDDDTIRESTRQQLGVWGFECDAAESIEAALEIVEQRPPQLVISDYRLRDHRNGAEIVTELRKHQPLLPALLITGDTAPDRIREAIGYCIPLLHKPVAPSELYRAIVEALEHA